MITVEELQIRLQCDATQAKSVLDEIEKRVNTFVEKVEDAFKRASGGSGDNPLSNVDFKGVENGTKALADTGKALTTVAENAKQASEAIKGVSDGKNISKAGALTDKLAADYKKLALLQEEYEKEVAKSGADSKKSIGLEQQIARTKVSIASTIEALDKLKKKEQEAEEARNARSAQQKFDERYEEEAKVKVKPEVDDEGITEEMRKAEEAALKAAGESNVTLPTPQVEPPTAGQPAMKASAEDPLLPLTSKDLDIAANSIDQMSASMERTLELAGEFRNKLADALESTDSASFGEVLLNRIRLAEREIDALSNKLIEAFRSGASGEKQLSIEKRLQAAIENAEKLQATLDKLREEQEKPATETPTVEPSVSEGGGSKFMSFLDGFYEVISDVGQAIRTGLSSAASFASTAISGLFSAIGSALSFAGSAVRTVIGVLGSVANVAGKAISGIMGVAKRVGGAIKSAFDRSPIGRFLSTLKRLKTTLLRTLTTRAVRAALNGIKEGFDTIAESSESCAQALAQFKAAGSTMKASLAGAVMPVLKALAPLFYQIASAAAAAANAIAAFFAALTGQGRFTAISIKKDMASIEKSAGGGGGALKGLLADFDELNIVQSEGGGGGGGGGIDWFGETADDTELPDWAQRIKDSIDAGDWAGAATALTDHLNGLIAGIKWSDLGASFGTKVNNVLTFINTAVKTFDWSSVGSGIATFLNNAISNIDFETLGSVSMSGFNIVLNSLHGFVTTFDFEQLGTSIHNRIVGALNSINWGDLKETIGTGFMGIFTSLKFAVAKVDWKNLGKQIVYWLRDLVKNKIDWYEVSSVLNDLFKGLFDTLNTILEEVNWEELGGSIARFLEDCLSGVNLLEVAWNFAKALAKAILGALKELFVGDPVSPDSNLAPVAGTNMQKFYHDVGNAANTAAEAVGNFNDAYTTTQSFDSKEINIDADTTAYDQKVNEIEGATVTSTITSVVDNGSLSGARDEIDDAVKIIDATLYVYTDGTTRLVTDEALDYTARDRQSTVYVNYKEGNAPSSSGSNNYNNKYQSALPFASGGLVYGETFARIGEYVGARNNPEVVAPLSDLRNILASTNTGNGNGMTREQANTMIGLLQRVADKELTVEPSAELGRVTTQSLKAYGTI